MDFMHDVAIIGAGVAGSSLAKDMAARGWDTVLIDGKSFPRHKVCGEFLSPESLGTLDELGLRKTVERLQPRRIERARLIVSSGGALDVPLPGTGLGVSRYALDSALHQAAYRSGVELVTGTPVAEVHPAGGGFRLVLKPAEGGLPQELLVRSVIGAWGANPRLMRLQRPRDRAVSRTGGCIGVKSHFTGIPMEPVVELYFFPGGYLGLSPIEGDRVNVCALLKRQAFPEAEPTVSGLLDAACRRHPLLRRRLLDASPVPGTEAAVAPVRLDRQPLTWGRFAHVGDASLLVPPLCGDGMSMALRSARLCARLADRYLDGTVSLAQWQAEYALAVQREFAGPLRWGTWLHSLSGLPVLPRLLLALAQLMPNLAASLVKATRLKGRGS
ncbi:NAD(P)/FAD-dependent oxidoreductase [Paenibacillus doosanensis]|uniref:NAD(P)/FAD-dependent oxidoreductase n=1 Tax=Paenibacillus doosanensis TaxID=1229154 RepID=UPI00217F379F|nr:NAD(P)/FAD-dependent oxidoreductase [Paenibacillus doosanensis]MCS7463941.1 NAD(P)/FAD-dependent oxidoreductase [Paenibacillus doosanensis]